MSIFITFYPYTKPCVVFYVTFLEICYIENDIKNITKDPNCVAYYGKNGIKNITDDSNFIKQLSSWFSSISCFFSKNTRYNYIFKI